MTASSKKKKENKKKDFQVNEIKSLSHTALLTKPETKVEGRKGETQGSK
jgi:hypothetical protein